MITHGLDEKLTKELGITEHTVEDCQVSNVLASAMGKDVVVQGKTAWVIDDTTITRCRISAGTRRRLLAGNTGSITLEPWVEA